ncbi:MAG TPA: ABC transporter permease [Chitinophagaceae bacterium]|nr:ABC transporter permease [Chitinophagaceae bacterium]
MLKNYFKTAVRSLARNKMFTIVNIAGLAIGLACCMLIAVFVYDELSYDKYTDNPGQLYRVQLGVLGNGNEEVYPNVDVAVGAGMKDAFPEIEAYTRVMSRRESYVQYKDKQFKETGITFADSNFLQMFSIPVIDGDGATALRDPNSIVITRPFAQKYFGNQEPVGKLLSFNTGQVLKVTGIINEIPANSHFHFDAIVSLSSFPERHPTWSNIGYYTYLRLKKGTNPAALQARFPQLVEKYVVPEISNDMGITLAEAQKSANTFKFTLFPVTDIHLHSNTKYEIEANGDINYVYIFGALAIFILLLACVNFTNLSTAGAAKRAREVGIRKVMGSAQKQLVAQFLTESTLVAFSAMLLSLGIVALILPFFNQVAGKHISFSFFIQLPVLASLLLLCIVVGVLAGIYPAFFISAFQPIKVLKAASAQGSGRKNMLRSSLVVFQFFVSTALIISTILVYRQLHFMQDKKVGYDKEQVLVLPDARLLGGNQDAFEQQLLKDNHVLRASISRGVPATGVMNGTEIYGHDDATGINSKEIHSNIYNVDYDYIPTLGMQMVQGRNFSRDFGTDSFGVIINEAAVRSLGWTNANAVGKTIVRSGQHKFKVIGVVADFHYASVKEKIAPLMLLPGNNYGGLILKIKTTGIPGFLASLKNKWNAFSPAGPLAYYFLDDKFAALYVSEQRTGQIFTSFAIIAIVIASLGLFGLAAFITGQRTKEIGIRKVLGASVLQVLVLVTKEFVLLVGIACLIAIPVTWWAMSAWLQNFAYRAAIAWWIFAAAGVMAIVIALFTVSSQAIKAALANPVNSLKAE